MKHKAIKESEKRKAELNQELSPLSQDVFLYVKKLLTDDYESKFRVIKQRHWPKIEKLKQKQLKHWICTIEKDHIPDQKQTVINLTCYEPTVEEMHVLELGLNLA